MSVQVATAPARTAILDQLATIVGSERLVLGEDARQLLALDFSEEPGAVPIAVVEPVEDRGPRRGHRRLHAHAAAVRPGRPSGSV